MEGKSQNNPQAEDLYISEDDAKLFNQNQSESSDEENQQNKHLVEAFKKTVQVVKPNNDDSTDNWFEFKENDGLTKMLERKLEEKVKENDRLEFENKKKCKRIMKNPIEYINFLKSYLLCSLFKLVKTTKQIFSDLLQAYVLSKFTIDEINSLEKIAKVYKTKKTPFDFLIKDLFRIFSKKFIFKKFNAYYLLYNLAITNNYTHEQITWLFIALCQYLRIPVRFVSIIDLKSFNLDKKYRVNIKSLENNSKNAKKRKTEDFPEKVIKKKQNVNLIDKCIKSLIEGPTSNLTIPKQSNYDKSSSSEDSPKNEEKNQLNRFVIPDLDDYLINFQYKQSGRKTKEKNKQLSENLKKNLPSNINDNFNEIIDIREFNFDNTMKSVEKSTKTRQFCDYYEENEFKYWVEVFDYELRRWVVVNPILQEIYKEINPKFVQEKIQGTSSLFIISTYKAIEPEYNKKNEEKDDIKQNEYIFKKFGVFIEDVTVRYCEKWTKILIQRRQLGLKYWWELFFEKLDEAKHLKFDEFYQVIRNSNIELFNQIIKEDIPTNYNEFRNSPFYMLASHLRKYQGLKPLASPIADMIFKEEPVYLRSDVVDLHTKTKWKTLGRKVKMGQIGVKKVLALTTNDGEQMVDLYGEWQTEEFKNILNEDGTLPKNEYGNFELFNGDPPTGTLHLDLPYITKLCQKFEIEYVETVTGFEKKNGRCHPIKHGVLIFEREKEKVLMLYEEYAKEMFEKEKEKETKKVLIVWKKLFKSLLIKRYIRDNYENA